MGETGVLPPPVREDDSHGTSSHTVKRVVSPRERVLLVVLALVAGTLILYRPALRNSFVNYDDPLYVVQNAQVRQGLSWHNVAWAFSTTRPDYWHPLAWISHMADVQVFGLRPMGHHLDSILWHIVNVVFLFLLLQRATGYLWRSATVASLFALSPLNVECVAWIAERKSLISTTFLLLTLFAYGWYARRPNAARYAAVAVLLTLGLSAKPMLVTTPLLLLLIDYWPLKRISLPQGSEWNTTEVLKRAGRLALEKVPLLILSAVVAGITLYAQKAAGALSSTRSIPMRLRVENAIYSYVVYIAKAFWPTRLAVYYPHPGDSLRTISAIGAALVLIAITVAVWRWRDKREFLVGWLWFIITLIPVIGIAQVGEQAWADRYGYVSLIGIFVMCVWLASDLAQNIQWRRPLRAAVALAALTAYAGVSHAQIGYWKNSFTLFTHSLQVTSRNGVAEANLGVALLDAGRPDLAEPHLRNATEFAPSYATPYFDLGVALQQERRFEEALQAYRQRLGFAGDPTEEARAHNNIASILQGENNLPAALAEYNAALRLDPEESHSLLGRGMIEYGQGEWDAALADLKKSAGLWSSPVTYSTMGHVYENEGNLKAAAECYERALTIDPNFAEASSRLGSLGHKPAR